MRRTRLLPRSETSSAPSAATASPCGEENCASSAGPPSPPPPSALVPAMWTGVPEPPGSRRSASRSSSTGPRSARRRSARSRRLGDLGDGRRRTGPIEPLERVPDRDEDAAGRSTDDCVGPEERRNDHAHAPRRRPDAQHAPRVVLDQQQRAVRLEIDRGRLAEDERLCGRTPHTHGSELGRRPPARAVSRHSPAVGKTSRARYEPRRPAAERDPARAEAVTWIDPAYEAGRTARRTVHARPATGAGRFPLRDTWTGPAADAEQVNSAESTTAPQRLHVRSDARGGRWFAEWRHAEQSEHRAVAVAVAAGLWAWTAHRHPLPSHPGGDDRLRRTRCPRGRLPPGLIAALPALWRAGPRSSPREW